MLIIKRNSKISAHNIADLRSLNVVVMVGPGVGISSKHTGPNEYRDSQNGVNWAVNYEPTDGEKRLQSVLINAVPKKPSLWVRFVEWFTGNVNDYRYRPSFTAKGLRRVWSWL